MKKLIILIGMLCTAIQVSAHQPDLSSTILVEQEENRWVFQIRAALTAFEYEIHQHYGEHAYASPEEFKELVLNYVKNHVAIHFNEAQATELYNGMVKLGHETSVTFEVEGIPETFQSLNVKNNSFGDIPRNQSALIVLKKDFSKEQFTLNQGNDHTVQLNVKDKKFELVRLAKGKVSNPFFIFTGALLIIIILLFTLRKKA